MGHVYLSFSKGSNREADKQLELHRVVTEHPGVAGPPPLDLASWERQNPSSHLGPLHLHLSSEQKPCQGASRFTALGDYILSGLWAPVGSKNEDMASLCSMVAPAPSVHQYVLHEPQNATILGSENRPTNPNPSWPRAIQKRRVSNGVRSMKLPLRKGMSAEDSDTGKENTACDLRSIRTS